MATLEEMVTPAESDTPEMAAYKDKLAKAQHVLLIGASKSGKSDWVTQAVLAGFDLVYFDNDNGFPTLVEHLSKNKEAMRRLHYFRPADFTELTEAVLTQAQVRYNERTRLLYQPHTAKDDDKIAILWPNRMPLTTIVSWDSLTSLCFDAQKDAAKKAGVNLTQIDKYSREIYGPSGFLILQFAQAMQFAPFNIIVQAHPMTYEIKEKPAGFSEARDIKEGDMIIKDTWEIPQGTSAPNGYQLGKHFNQIGWLELGKYDRFVLSFKAKHRRVVGGTPQSEGDPRSTHSYASLFGKGLVLPAKMDPEKPWIEYLTAGELKERINASKAATATVKAAPAKPAAASIPTGNIGGLKLGK